MNYYKNITIHIKGAKYSKIASENEENRAKLDKTVSYIRYKKDSAAYMPQSLTEGVLYL